ncbi:hypothetical protein VSDG_04554 [Cytospora chrysosperma]|uniref:Uncharacterized protein n=1 Tax=Cytospora chrysosperma TaxID=252740 RepID=A0A423W2Q6_CYTCH|nr:hypothetical protein VSDG_04554 [Valsa sordida]
MATLSPILIVVIAASAVLLSLPAMFLVLAWHTHRQRVGWKEEHDRAVESIDQERQSSRESRMAPSPPSPPSPPSGPRNKGNKNRGQPVQQQQQQQRRRQQEREERVVRDAAVQRRSSTMPPRPARELKKPRGSRFDTAPQVDGFQFEGVLPGWGQRVRSSSPPRRLDMRAVDGE